MQPKSELPSAPGSRAAKTAKTGSYGPEATARVSLEEGSICCLTQGTATPPMGFLGSAPVFEYTQCQADTCRAAWHVRGVNIWREIAAISSAPLAGPILPSPPALPSFSCPE